MVQDRKRTIESFARQALFVVNAASSDAVRCHWKDDVWFGRDTAQGSSIHHGALALSLRDLLTLDAFEKRAEIPRAEARIPSSRNQLKEEGARFRGTV